MDIKLLQDELQATVQKREALRAKYANDNVLPPEARAEDVALTERATKVQAAIEVENQKMRDAQFGDLTSYLRDPLRTISHPINTDDDGRKELLGSGWKIANGLIARETSLGMVNMYPEDVLFGPIPKQAESQKYVELTRAGFQPEYRAAYLKFLAGCAVLKESSLALNALSNAEQKALSEGLDTAGGFLVPPDIQAEIYARTAQQSVFRSLGCRILNTSRDRVIWPRVEPASASTGNPPGATGGDHIFSSAFVGTWAGETPTASDIDAKFGTLELSVKKIRAQTKLSNDFIADAIANIPAFLATDGARNIALVEDNGFLNGGTISNPALEPLGLLNDAGLVTVDVDGSVAETISNSTSATGSAPKLIDVIYNLPAQYADNASWLMRRIIEGKIRKLVDGQGRFLWPLQSGSMFGSPNGMGVRSLMEYNIKNSDFMPNDGVDLNKVLVFGDFSTYIIVQRAQITSTVLRERYADTDQTGIILWERLGGGLSNPDAFRVGTV